MNIRFLSITLLSLTTILLLTACPDDPPQTADCDPGWHPCENDPSECCLDSTTHQANWIIDTLGMPGKDNVLYDAAVIDENNIWVVGEIYTDEYDSVHQNSFTVYNATHWDGSEWDLIKLPPQQSFFSYIKSIFIFNENDIWVGTNVPCYWNGEEWTVFTSNNGWEDGWNFDGWVKAIWGTSSSNIYFIGDNGSIVHYDGYNFTKMESGTDVDLRSISGTDENNVWVSGYGNSYLRTVLLHFDGTEWVKVIDEDANSDNHPERISGRIKGVYTDDPDRIWVLTQLGLYRCSVNTSGEGTWLGEESDPFSDIKAMFGVNHNDIYYGGAFTDLWHYNGETFHQYEELPDMGPIYGIAANASVVVIVGYLRNTSQGFVLRGYR